MTWTFALAPWFLVSSFWLPGYACIAGLVFGGFILAMPHPANVVMAQELMPRRAGIAASLITGLAWGLAMMLAMLGISMPSFWLGLMMIVLFAVQLGWLPTGGYVNFTDDPWGWLRAIHSSMPLQVEKSASC